MIHRKRMIDVCIAGSLLALSAGSTSVRSETQTITLMQLQDVHGHIHPHAEIFPDGRKDPHSGGLAKLSTLIKEVRKDAGEENSLLLAIGDTTHGSTETTFSLGDVLMPWLNDLDIDAFTPGNWDFGYGPRVYRQRFTPNTTLELAPNNRTTIAWMDGMPGRETQKCNQAGGLKPYAECHVTKATFPTVAMNVYNYNEVAGAGNPAQPLGPPVHIQETVSGEPPFYKTYIIKEVNGIKVAILGLTSDVVPQQAQAFNTGFRFTMGYKEMPEQIAAAQADGAELIVVLSELGLAKNVQFVKEFPEIDVMFSGHTHERTPEAIVIDHGDHISLVTEAGEDSFLGRLDLEIYAGKIHDYNWDLMEADSSVEEDEEVAEYVEDFRKTFVAGPDFQCHTFGVNAFPFGTGHTVCEPMDKVIGYTEVTIQRYNVLEDISNNVMVDAFLDLAKNVGDMDSKGNPLTDANTLSTTNGFRFDIVIFGDGEELSDARSEEPTFADGRITVEDLYDYYPIGAATGLAEYTGGRLKLHWEGILNNVFDPNPYRQRGGWFLGFTHNMHFDIRLDDDYPLSISAGKRITGLTIDGSKLDDSKIYTLASCYPHGNPIDEVCRTAGATNLRFITGVQEKCEHPAVFAGGIENCQIDVSRDNKYKVVAPVNSENIWDPVRFANGGPLFLKVAPDNFVHPVDALRRYLPNNPVTVASHGLGRVTGICSPPENCKEIGPGSFAPISEYGGEDIVQPTQGAGPAWLKREFVE